MSQPEYTVSADFTVSVPLTQEQVRLLEEHPEALEWIRRVAAMHIHEMLMKAPRQMEFIRELTRVHT